MKKTIDVYLYGMTVLSTIHKLEGPYPAADTYREISRSYELPGGETGNAAILLSQLGLKVKSDGSDLGAETRLPLLGFHRKYGIDCSGMRCDKTFEGWRDLVLVDSRHRTVFGKFASLLFHSRRKWNRPDETAIQKARMASIDPFFRADSERAARLCRKAGTPFVTIDCPPQSDCHRYSAANVVSREYLNREFRGRDWRKLLGLYKNNSSGLTVFTFGARDIWYARRDGPVRRMKPFRVKTSGTLGAGDAFRAGLVYGLFREWDDSKSIRFAAALAACVCRNFPVALHPPTLPVVHKMMRKG
jgi:sugar/nucleoside kinase (ribokinase family)